MHIVLTNGVLDATALQTEGEEELLSKAALGALESLCELALIAGLKVRVTPAVRAAYWLEGAKACACHGMQESVRRMAERFDVLVEEVA